MTRSRPWLSEVPDIVGIIMTLGEGVAGGGVGLGVRGKVDLSSRGFHSLLYFCIFIPLIMTHQD